MLIDTHAHLNFDNYATDRGAVLDRARAAGVERLVCIGMLPAGGREVLGLAREYPGRVYASVGVHPYDAALLDDAMLGELEALLREPEMVLMGEMGIDTVKAEVPLPVQERAFARQLELARDLDLPVCIHSRDAFAVCERVIRAVCPNGWKGFAHCFSDGVEEALGWKALGFKVSFAGQITFKNKSCDAIRAAARALGPDDVVVETDSPFLAPTPHRGKRNEPAWVRHTAETLATLWGVEPETAFAATSRTAAKVLDLG
jgi:TatD DNase family protein